MSKLLRGSSSLLALIIAGCAKERPPFDPREFQLDERGTAGEVLPRDKQPLPTTLQSPFLPATTQETAQPTPVPATGPVIGIEPTVRVSLREVVQRAVANNLDVKVEGYQPAIEQTRVIEAEARFDPAFFTTAQFEDRNDPPGGSNSILGESIASGGEAEIFTLRSGVRQVLPSGGEIELRYQVQHNDTVNVGAFGQAEEFSYWENELALQITQPLLRDFGVETNRARIEVARNNQRISLLDFRRQLEQTVGEIEEVYWTLVQAMRDVAIQEELLNDTLATARLLFNRRFQDVTRVQISQANASVEIRRAGLIRARARVRDLSDELKRRMNDPEIPVTGSTLLLPANDPLEQPVRFALEDQIATGLENRLELGQQQLRIDSTYIAARVARQNLLPQLNGTFAIGANGTSDDLGNGDLGSAFENQAEFNNISYAVGLQFEIPIGNRAARAGYRRSRLQQEQAITQYAALIDQIAFEIKQALREVETTWEEMVATRQAVFAAEDALHAIRQREEANEPLTPEFVDRKLNQQERLAEARRAAAAAVTNYNNAIARLELRKGTLLRYNNIIMEEAGVQLAGK
ncbi:MAG TPA: TolC family protein [Tepidisphaeraceae bacterium]|nr:TolC family protein [Tepidisphaeraceae bacterium]